VNMIGKLALVAGILAIALAVPLAAANVIYVYETQATVKPVTPVVFLTGPDASAVSLSVTNGSNPQVTLTIPVTNSSETYVYQALEIKVNTVWTGPWYLYVDSCYYTPGPTLSSVEIKVYSITGTPPTGSTDTITITPSATSCTATGYVTLTAGSTYYIDFLVKPSLPIKYGTSSGLLTIYFGLSNESVATVPTS